MIVKVHTRIEFEVEYPLNTESYGTDDMSELLAMEEDLVGGDPDIIVSLFKDRGGRTTVTVNKVE